MTVKQAPSHGNQSNKSTTIHTAIPPTIYTQITQTKSSPQTIASLLNEAENKYSDTPLHWNAKRRYPYWKTCQICDKPFPTTTKEQAHRKKCCSLKCVAKAISGPRPQTRKPLSQRKITQLECPVCGKKFWRYNSYLKKSENPTCSRQCNGKIRAKELIKHSHKGHQGWSQTTKEKHRQRMLGPRNHAWKGGVTYFKTHGNYKGVKYLRSPPEYLPMARKDGYIMEHRLIMAKHVGRLLTRREVVHHIDHDPTNNKIENLKLFPDNQTHKKYEGREPQ